ncbi:voltage-dependent calcium channel subunit alpha-2/delta-3 [Mustelus asterias]
MQRDMHILQAFCSFSVIVWTSFSITLTQAKESQQQIPLNVVKLWASAFGGEIKSISAKYSGSQFLQKKYKEHEKSVTVQEIDGLQLVKKLAKDMERIFRNKAEAMRRLVEAAENAHLEHEYNSDLEYEYFNAVLINEKDENGNYVELGKEFILEPNEHFNNLPVNVSLSDVQIPTNKYNKDPAIVNGVSWSEALNKIFVDNFERDPSLLWQYFGSANGFFRQYPGVKWEPDENGVIAFDCRNRKWYIQAATSPKDIIILVDVSGSMKGLRMTIAKQTVSSILDTLGDDDFFNIIAYNEELHYVEPCINDTLVQADRNNKEHFREHLDTLNAKGIGMLGFALTEAFILLKQFNNTGQGSICSQAIMLVTDGAVDTYDTIFAKYNWPDRKVRIFAYLIGREAVFSENLKWMACANKGYFTQISTLADVQENVMEYLHVLSRPKVIDQEHDIVWTEAYIDNTLPQAKKQVVKIQNTLPESMTVGRKNSSFPKGIGLLRVYGTEIDHSAHPVKCIQMKLEFFQKKFWTASRQCASLDGRCTISCDDEIINCYLIDNNGFILVSENYDETGTFFGEVEGAVMNKLLMMGSFKRITLYDYQAMCRATVDNSDSAHSLLDPYYVFFAAIKWIMTELILFLVEFNLCSWWNSDFTVKAQSPKQVLQPCDTEYPAFVSERTIKETTGAINCEGCHKSFVIQQIPSSNLFMVVVDASCDCAIGPITMDPIEIMYNESLKCDHLRSQKIRRRPDSCHPFHAEENARECGGALGLRPCLAILLLPLLVASSQR